MRERTGAIGASATFFVTDRSHRAWSSSVHVRTPYRVRVPSRIFAAPALGLCGLVYMESGLGASRVESGHERVAVMGCWEEGFHESDDLHEMWDLRDVVGVEWR